MHYLTCISDTSKVLPPSLNIRLFYLILNHTGTQTYLTYTRAFITFHFAGMFCTFPVNVIGFPWYRFDVIWRVNQMQHCVKYYYGILLSYVTLSNYCRASSTQLHMVSILLFGGQFVKDWTSKCWFQFISYLYLYFGPLISLILISSSPILN